MSILRIMRGIAAVGLRDFLEIMIRPKTVATAVLVGLVILLLAWAMSQQNLSALGAEKPAETNFLWYEGADGVFVTIQVGIIPLVLPLLPIIISGDLLQRDRKSRYLEMLMSRRVVRSGIALARYGAVLLAVAVPVVIMNLGSVVLIQNILGESVNGGLILATLGSSVLLGALYLGLSSVLSDSLSPGLATGLCLLVWIGFNAISRTAFYVGGQFLLIVPSTIPQTFQASAMDLASFTGAYVGLLAPFIPSELGLIVWPPIRDWVSLLISWLAVFIAAPWMAALMGSHLFLFSKVKPTPR